jgi:hypothetical protein
VQSDGESGNDQRADRDDDNRARPRIHQGSV